MNPTERGGASTELQKRFRTVLAGLDGRAVGVDALFDALRLEVLDWRLDHNIDVEALRGAVPSRIIESARVPPEGEAAS